MTTTRQRLGLNGEGVATRNGNETMLPRGWGGGDHTTPRVDYLKMNNSRYYLGDLRKADFDQLQNPVPSVRSLYNWACYVSDILRGFVDSGSSSMGSDSTSWVDSSTSSTTSTRCLAYAEGYGYIDGLGIGVFQVAHNGAYVGGFTGLDVSLENLTAQYAAGYTYQYSLSPDFTTATSMGEAELTLSTSSVYLLRQEYSSSTGPSEAFDSVLVYCDPAAPSEIYLQWGAGSSSI